jgi:hypothetical protein
MQEYLVNADFDLTLRPGWRSGPSDGRGRQAREMPYHLLLLGVGGDSVLVDADPSDYFVGYLERAGFPRPLPVVKPAATPSARFSPFGWNQTAEKLNISYDRPVPHPPVETVRRVNGRRYAARLEREFFDVEEVVGVFDTLGGLENHLVSQPEDEGWLVKSEHGNSGLGNRRLRSPALSESDRGVIGRMLEEDHCVLLERWRRRLLDLSTVFDVGSDGSIRDIYAYEVVNTADGAFIGSIFETDSEILAPWRRAVVDVATEVGQKLFNEGYFGPVCLDHFVWTDGDGLNLRPLTDLNARLQVSAPFLRLWRSWSGDRVVYWRLFASRKLHLPSDYGELEQALGADAFDSASRLGVLVTSPFEVAGKKLRRIGVLLSATTRSEVEELDRKLRERFER